MYILKLIAEVFLITFVVWLIHSMPKNKICKNCSNCNSKVNNNNNKVVD